MSARSIPGFCRKEDTDRSDDDSERMEAEYGEHTDRKQLVEPGVENVNMAGIHGARYTSSTLTV